MSIAKSVKPLPGFIVIEEVEPETKTASGLVLPDSAQEKPQIGKVIAVGAEQLKDGKFVGLRDAGVGNTIVYKKYTGHIVKVDGKEYQIVGFDDLIGKIE